MAQMAHDVQVLVFASQKGGSGKTTLSGHIAVQAELSGAGPVALMDTDPQGSMAKWWNARASDAPMFAQTKVETLARDIALLRDSGIKLIVIDTPPAVTSAITEVISYADLVVVPTRPSPHDLRAVGVTVDLVEQQQKPLVFVVNCATARARITGETAVSLSQHGTVAPATIHNRVDFAASMIDGRTVGEINPNSRSAKEVLTLWNYMEERLRRLRRSHDPDAAFEGPQFEVELLTPIRAPLPETTPLPKPAPAEDVSPAWQDPTGLLEEAQKKIWEGIDRRSVDAGPPPGVIDRRTARPFGRRSAK